MTDVAHAPAGAPAPGPDVRKPHWAKRRVLWPLRNLWRSLTSMRTALVLLFLLALAAIPGALLPQRELNEQKTLQYIADHGTLGEWMDRVQLFDVFSSAWFTAIYVLLFVSLVGCLTPRMIEHVRTLRAKPVAAPRNLSRLPRHVEHTVDGTPEEIADRINGRLRGWRRIVVTRPSSDGLGSDGAGVVEVSAEKGYLREFGNLVFHFALLALLVAIAVGKLYGYEGTRSLVADGEQSLCNNSTAVYDSFRAGSLVDGTDLSPFCFRIDKFSATFLPSGQPDMYDATVRYSEGPHPGDPATWNTASVRVNEPLRIAGDRVYVLGNGFAPTFTVTFPGGETRTQTVPFVPDELSTMMSSGAVRFDTPAGLYPDEDVRRKNQIAIEGLFAPTANFTGAHGGLVTSSSPVPNNPVVAIDIYKGDTGLDTGRPQNAYQLDRQLIEQGRLVKQARVNLGVGQSAPLADGSSVRFDGYQRWVSVQVSHDPAQNWVLVSAIAMLGGLLVSLLVRRRRIWARLVPVPGERRTVVEIAGLARTDQAGWGEGFAEQAADLVSENPDGTTAARRFRPRRL
ncbi:ResB family protein [Gordonia bronchialis DSM 43247]|uniref:ResB family protein n=1 Tax=Gordonia bronchialis (strain ATCC 25592 / DSM 43247 / BCRC 13721 / JCM 3198 / KCTC 3076 / NBRC 16047 / NCTC 10667) TaxID=526226 RepID=D0L4C4_GORB4|nr:ResB family protein [Gordonia bronchialis DSM 43247]UAK37758.1 cytochrome c biogenesis protein ResB [Gordonia bronchialis]STQ63152.1 ResB-like family [Gordonia bronchialis]